MSFSRHARTPMPRHHAFVLLITVVLGVLACAVTQRAGEVVPPQSWRESRGPVVPHDTFPRDCSICHAGSNWQAIRADFKFDHLAETGVALEGAHQAAECLRCHNDRGPVTAFAARGCAGCHDDEHRGKLGKNCVDCHTQTNWLPVEQVARHNRTRFPLVGAHAATACFRCHPGAQVGNFDRTDIQCVTCHADDLAQATSPDHQAQGWTSNCDRCHIPTTWAGAGFNHSTFPLTGAHQTVACTTCHVGNVFAGTPSDCRSCHLDDYNGTTDPNHAAAGFPTTCQQCHSTSSWRNATFNHSSFPLTGAHVALDCAACHAGNVFRGTPSNCAACHIDDYNGTNDPDHAAAGFPTTCQQCHNTVSWRNANFSHAGIRSGCVQCHLADYNSTNDPNHSAAGFPTNCEACHTTRSWDGAKFNHPFPITSGAHSNIACAQCHLNPGNFRSFSCTSCHEHNQNDTDNDHDRVGGYVYQSQACYACHPNGSH